MEDLIPWFISSIRLHSSNIFLDFTCQNKGSECIRIFLQACYYIVINLFSFTVETICPSDKIELIARQIIRQQGRHVFFIDAHELW